MVYVGFGESSYHRCYTLVLTIILNSQQVLADKQNISKTRTGIRTQGFAFKLIQLRACWYPAPLNVPHVPHNQVLLCLLCTVLLRIHVECLMGGDGELRWWVQDV